MESVCKVGSPKESCTCPDGMISLRIEKSAPSLLEKGSSFINRVINELDIFGLRFLLSSRKSKRTELPSFPSCIKDYDQLKEIVIKDAELKNLHGLKSSSVEKIVTIGSKINHVDGKKLPSGLKEFHLQNNWVELKESLVRVHRPDETDDKYAREWRIENIDSLQDLEKLSVTDLGGGCMNCAPVLLSFEGIENLPNLRHLNTEGTRISKRIYTGWMGKKTRGSDTTLGGRIFTVYINPSGENWGEDEVRSLQSWLREN